MKTLRLDIPKLARRRGEILFLSCTVFFGIGFLPAMQLLGLNGWTMGKGIVLVLFAVLLAQISFGVSLSILGFWALRGKGDPWRISQTLPEGRKSLPSTAVVMPIFNEDVNRVFQGVRVMFESLAKTNRGESFDFFVLSDSNSSNHWIEEEKSWLALCKQVGGFSRIFYRKRRVQLNHKSGNIADFCRRWGANYRYMVVLDADSIMSGATLVKLVELMEANRSVGIIQTAPQLVLGNSLFRRIQQFAARFYGPIFMAGSSYWHLGGGNYWGHNAIIRTRVFMEHCALPVLPKVGPVGGRILSHDTVEAAFVRRAGYGVWFAYDLDGSYEEGPPELVSSLKRDRRWCQGNMQHLLVVFRRGLRLSSRVHILLGVLAYGSSPLWFTSIVLSTLLVFMGEGDRNSSAGVLAGSILQSGLLFCYVLTLLLLPKGLAFVHHALSTSGFRSFGGGMKVLASMLTEIIFSMLLAPILMISYSKFVFSALTGLQVKWGAQKRGDERPSWSELLKIFGVQSLCTLGAWVGLGIFAPQLIPWLLPVLIGLILAVPFARITSSVKLGEWARTKGWLLIPEEVSPPPELRELDRPLVTCQSSFFAQREYASELGLLQAVLDPYVNAIHVSLLRLREQVADKVREYSQELRWKLLRNGPSSLTNEERNSLLWDAEALISVHRDLWLSPSSDLDLWWQNAVRHYNESTQLLVRRWVTGDAGEVEESLSPRLPE